MATFDLEAVKRKLAKLSGNKGNSNVQLWKPILGDHRIRVLPWPNASPDSPLRELYFYYLNKTILAPFQFGKPDPINDFVRSLWETKKEEDKILAKKIRPSLRAFAPIIDRANEKQGPLVWGFGRTAYQRILGFYVDPEIGDFTDPNDGFDLIIKIVPSKAGSFAKQQLGDVDPARKSTKLSQDPEQAQQWLKAIPDLDQMYTLLSKSEIENELSAYLAGPSEPPKVDSESSGTQRGEEEKETSKIASKKVSPIDDEDEVAPKKSSKKVSKTDAEEKLDAVFKDLGIDE